MMIFLLVTAPKHGALQVARREGGTVEACQQKSGYAPAREAQQLPHWLPSTALTFHDRASLSLCSPDYQLKYSLIIHLFYACFQHC